LFRLQQSQIDGMEQIELLLAHSEFPPELIEETLPFFHDKTNPTLRSRV
jgi:hypothetical protein